MQNFEMVIIRYKETGIACDCAVNEFIIIRVLCYQSF